MIIDIITSDPGALCGFLFVVTIIVISVVDPQFKSRTIKKRREKSQQAT